MPCDGPKYQIHCKSNSSAVAKNQEKTGSQEKSPFFFFYPLKLVFLLHKAKNLTKIVERHKIKRSPCFAKAKALSSLKHVEHHGKLTLLGVKS